MTAKVVATTVILVVFVVVIAGGYVVSRRRSEGIGPGRPDHVSDDVVTGLMAELRKTQAERDHWKATAERQQRELDDR